MTAITYCEAMAGYVAFGETAYNTGWWEGRKVGTSCSFGLEVSIDDVDAFIADRDHEARCTGWVRCDALGGRLQVESGTFNLLQEIGGPRQRHMRYRLLLRDPDGRALTLSAFKNVEDDWFVDAWSDTSTLFTRVYAGHVDPSSAASEGLLATGILRISHLGFAGLLASMRTHGGSRRQRLGALARYANLFAGALLKVYAGRRSTTGQPDFPSWGPGDDRFQGHAPGEWHDCPGRPGLRRRILAVEARDGHRLTLHHVRGARSPDRGPVLLAHGTGVRAEIFYGAPLAVSVVDVLVDAGYDVFLENWRGSIDLPACQYTLDAVARHDHPAFVERVLAETGADTLKAVVHCQGSTSFSMAMSAGLLPGAVTHVVSNAVSFHVDVSRLSRVRGTVLLPLLRPGYPGLDPQWGIRPTALRARLFAGWARLVRRECRDPVCAMANYTYGVGGDVLWRHDNLDPDTHHWISREFGWVPLSFFRQIVRCVRAGHLVRVDDTDELPAEFFPQPPAADARWTLLAGGRNTCFLPSGQRRTFAWLDALEPGRHAHHELPDYTHLDLFFGRDAARDVFPLILAGLDGPG